MKSIIYEFDPVVYPFPLLVTTNYDPEDLRTRFNLVLNKKDCTEISDQFDPEPTLGARTGLLVRKDTQKLYYLISVLQPDLIDVGDITHEAIHVNTYNSWWLGFDAPQPGTDEPQAYFSGWVARCVDSVLKGKPDQMKGKLLDD